MAVGWKEAFRGNRKVRQAKAAGNRMHRRNKLSHQHITCWFWYQLIELGLWSEFDFHGLTKHSWLLYAAIADSGHLTAHCKKRFRMFASGRFQASGVLIKKERGAERQSPPLFLFSHHLSHLPLTTVTVSIHLAHTLYQLLLSPQIRPDRAQRKLDRVLRGAGQKATPACLYSLCPFMWLSPVTALTK